MLSLVFTSKDSTLTWPRARRGHDNLFGIGVWNHLHAVVVALRDDLNTPVLICGGVTGAVADVDHLRRGGCCRSCRPRP